jgi:two-component system, sensor histidine kinase and response regulator
MKNKQFYFPDKLYIPEHYVSGVNGNSQSNNNGNGVSDTVRKPENSLVTRINELERLNNNLRGLLKRHTEKLDEVVTSNTKSIAIIAHDLRSPFNAILIALNLLKKKIHLPESDETELYINIATKSATNAFSILEDLIDWAILQDNGLKFNPVKVNLRNFINEEIGKISTSVFQKQISLNYSIEPELILHLDIQMFRIILRNLIDNAIKFTGDNGKITVSVSECHPFVEIEVADNGIGISSEDQKNIFGNDNTNLKKPTGNGHGTGLGLKLCKEFTEMHGGNIRLESNPGEGSNFIFSIPLYT